MKGSLDFDFCDKNYKNPKNNKKVLVNKRMLDRAKMHKVKFLVKELMENRQGKIFSRKIDGKI